MEHICGDLEAGIDGGIHVVRLLCQKHAQEEDWEFLEIDALNAFNEEKHTAMMWVVKFEWTSGVRFALNCYLHWAMLVIRAGDKTGHFLFSMEGMTQGDPLAMVAYGLGILLIICELQKSHPGVTKPWYADDSGAGSTFEGIWRNLDVLMVRGSPQV